MAKKKVWKCEVCGYIHEGDQPPDECPVCGVGPDMFTLMEAVVDSAPPAAEAWRCVICDYQHDGPEPPEVCPVCGAERNLFEPVADKPRTSGGGSGGRLVIIGAGIAGVTAAEHAREQSGELEIILLCKEPGLPYYRLNLTRFLAGEISDDKLPLKPESWYREQRVELRHDEVSSVDREQRQLVLRDGERLGYDRLILANGAHPFIPPIAGATREGVFVCRTLDDARAIIERVTPGSRCVCIGGGLLGLETVGALAKRGATVTVLEGFDWLLPRQLAEPAGKVLQQYLEGLGMEIRCGVQVKEIVGDESVAGVKLGDGDTVPADLVVLATGVRPNSHLARRSGLEVERGVIVNDQMESSDPSIYAAGDVAEHRGVVYGIWPTAYAQGAVAGANAGGGTVQFLGMPPSSRLKVLAVDVFSVGEFTAADGSYQVYEDQIDGNYRRLVCHDGRLVGANLYGDTDLAGTIRDAVEANTQIRELTDILEQIPGLAEMCGLTQ